MRWGGNAVYNTRPPFYVSLWKEAPATTLGASGRDVGLLPQTAGNSEAGHLNIGAGRIVGQDLAWIQNQIDSRQFLRNGGLNEIFAAAAQNGRPVHIVGLLSDGGTHAHIDHMYALLELANKYKPVTLYFHVFGDGRDTEPHRIKTLLDRLQMRMGKYQIGNLASIIGRYYAMDRNRNFDRTKKAFDLLTRGVGESVTDWQEGIDVAYKRGLTDEYLPAMTLRASAQQSRIKNGDYVIITNFRADRIWQIEEALVGNDFAGFTRQPLAPAKMVSFVPIETAPNLESVMRPPDTVQTLGEILSQNGVRQLRLAESEKGAHATYFLNGGRRKPFSGQVDRIVPSPNESYVKVPEMSAYQLLPLAERAIGGEYGFIFLNLANPDMVGHTGNMEAGMKAIKVVDDIVSRLCARAKAAGSVAIVTSDHGNCDEMIIPYSGESSTDHSTNKVPFFLVSNSQYRLRHGGRLCDVAPTVLELLGLQKPAVMTGQSLIS